MNYLQCLFFLASLSGLSLINLILIRILDFANAFSKQKIILIKIGLVVLALAPFIFTLWRLSSWQVLEITLPGQFANQLSTSRLSITLTEHQINWPFYIFLVYGMGFLMMLSRILFSYLSAIKKLGSSFESVIQEKSILLNEHIESPLSFGFPKAKIYFPSDAEKKWTPREIQMSIAHEKIHVEQNDSLWKLLSLIVQALLFFVPWAYSLHRKLELEMEIFCDEKTCVAANADTKEYGSLLLAMTCAQPENLRGNLIFTNMTDSTIKRRLLAMKSKTMKRSLLISVLSTFLVLSGATAIAMTSGIADKNKNTFKITSKIFIDGKLVSSPVIVALENQKALIVITNTNDVGAQGLRMELVARNVSKYGRNDAIGINYDIQYSNGAEKMHSKPQVIVTPHQEGRINISSDSNHSYEMYVLAEREKSES